MSRPSHTCRGLSSSRSFVNVIQCPRPQRYDRRTFEWRKRWAHACHTYRHLASCNNNNSDCSATYVDIEASYTIFQPIAVESLGSINESGYTSLSKLGRKIFVQSGDDRKTSFFVSATLRSYSVFQCYSTTRQFCWGRRAVMTIPAFFSVHSTFFPWELSTGVK